MLLNIDLPHRTCTLHEESCSYIPSPFGTQFKPVGSLGRDGGWFSVASHSEATIVATREFPRGELIRCQNC
jgi:hypothetical protein